MSKMRNLLYLGLILVLFLSGCHRNVNPVEMVTEEDTSRIATKLKPLVREFSRTFLKGVVSGVSSLELLIVQDGNLRLVLARVQKFEFPTLSKEARTKLLEFLKQATDEADVFLKNC
ncbi:MAG: hypothetical protein D3913_15390 [Candidatus Electrothrix sp. LOE1_4_5]|nr:hypothetical protein [Candidatus Electrothrix gigas]